MAVVEEILIGSKADTRGFKKAETAAAKLTKTVKTLAGTLGLAYGTAALVSFGKAAVKAFAADEAAALRLSTAVDNLGISFANPAIAKFISELETTAGVADDVLRPAFQGLLTTTGSLTHAQKLLNDAITISRASGFDLATVAEDLAKGFVGTTRGLLKYNTGLTKAEIASKSFSDTLGIILTQSAGAANAYLETTSYKFDVLTIAVDNAREAIGEGLVDALARAGGGTEAQEAVTTIDSLAKGVNAITLAIGTAVGGFTTLLKLVKNLPGDVFEGFVGARGRIDSRPSVTPKKPEITKTQQQKALEKLEQDALKRAKKIRDEQLKQTRELAKQAALKKAGSIFDLEQIGIVAALQGKLSEDDKLRLKAQLALLNGNEVVATALTKQILMAQDQTGNLYKLFLALPDARNPFAYLEGYLDMLAGKASRIFTLNPNQLPPELRPNEPIPVVPPSTSNVPTATERNQIFGTTPTARQATTYVGGTPIYVQIDGKTIASALQNSSLSGIGSSVNRTGR